VRGSSPASATSAENLIRLAFLVSELDPDLIVIQHGLNDARVRMTGTIASDYRNYRKSWEEPEAFQPDFSLAYSGTVWLMRMTMLGRWIGVRTNLVKNWNLSAYVDRPWEGDADENAARNDGRYFERNTRYMIALAKQMGARIVLATTPFTERVWEVQQRLTLEHGEIVRRVAKLEDVAFYDFAAEMPADDEHLPDGVHASQLGSDVKRDLFFDYLVRSGLVDALLGEESPQDSSAAQ
jgi:lysophospholipase L1-like esterase